MRTHSLIPLLCCLVILLSPRPTHAQLIEPFVVEDFDENWFATVQVKLDNRGRAFVLERRGWVWIIDEEGVRLPVPLIDIEEEIGFFGDHGALSIALHPEFLTNGYFYLLYTVDRHHLLYFGTPEYDPHKTILEQATIGRITRFTADPSTDFTTIVPGSRKVILGDRIDRGFPILMVSHGIGSLVFGTDGTLLASCGDGGSFQTADMGSASETYFEQALQDGIIRPKENVGSFRAQLIDCLNGKIIRIDPETGMGLPSNPFYDPANPDSPKSKVYAMGFRQPYRFCLQPGTGSHDPKDGDPGVLFIGDVGTGNYEELNIATRPGMNFGWPLYEGFSPQHPFHSATVTNPDAPNPLAGEGCAKHFFQFNELLLQAQAQDPPFVFECNGAQTIPDTITHFVHDLPAIAWNNQLYNPPARAYIRNFNEQGFLAPITIEDPLAGIEGSNFEGTASIPGFFYRGNHFPEKYRGRFFFSDFSGWIRTLQIDENYQILSIDTFHTDVEHIVDFAESPADGSIYMINLFHSVHRIKYGGNVPPRARIIADKYYGKSPLLVNFNALSSTDANNDPMTFHWDFGDGHTSDDPAPSHIFEVPDDRPGGYTVRLTVSDSNGASSTATAVISPNNSPPLVQITSPTDSMLYSLKGTNYLPLRAVVFDIESGDNELEYSWQWYLHHNTHFHPEFPIEGKEALAAISPAGCNGEIYYYRIELRVTDPQGLVSTDKVFIYPFCGDPKISEAQLDGEGKEKGVDLNWNIEGNAAVEKIEVQRGKRFGELLVIAELPPGSETYFDPSPEEGELTYRLKIHTSEGVYTYSNQYQVDFPPPPVISLAPNPVRDKLLLFMEKTQKPQVELEVFDASGKAVFQQNFWHTQIADPLSREIDLSHLGSGMYFYIIMDGSNRYDGNFVKVK